MPSSDLVPQSDNINFTETFIDDLSHDLKNLVQNLPAAPELPEKLDSSKKKKFIPKKLSRVKLVSKVTNIFKHVKSLSFILLPKKLHLIEKRYNAVLLLNRLGTDPEKMSVSELNVVYNNFKGNM